MWSQAFPPARADVDFLHRYADYGLTDPRNPYGIVARDLEEHLANAFAEGRSDVEEMSKPDQSSGVNGWLGWPHGFDYNVDFLGLGTIDAAEWKIADRAEGYASGRDRRATACGATTATRRTTPRSSSTPTASS